MQREPQDQKTGSLFQLPEPLSMLNRLASHENMLRCKEFERICRNPEFISHFHLVQAAMDVAYEHVVQGADDDDSRVTRIFSMRVFNAFASSIQLLLMGYAQNATLILRDVLETAFLLDLFRFDRSAIQRFRTASLDGSSKHQRREFQPIEVRMALDQRDGYKAGKRGSHYKRLCEVAAHPTMQSDIMMRPTPTGNATPGPFHSDELFRGVLEEMALMAGLFGETVRELLDVNRPSSDDVVRTYDRIHVQWHTDHRLIAESTHPDDPSSD